MTPAALLVWIGTCSFADGPAKGPPVPIVGTVVDADRRPAAGVGVSFSSFRTGGGWGEVTGRTQTDSRGEFRLEVPAAPGGGPRAGVLWAYRPGALIATRRITRETLPPDAPVSIVLDPPAQSEVIVRGPDGRLVAGARIEPRVLDRLSVPDWLAEEIAARAVTDDRGLATLTAFFPEEVRTVIVAAPGLGRQQFGLGERGGPPRSRTIDLRPVGRVEGRVVADDVEIVRGRKLEVTTRDSKVGPPALGLARVTTDERGGFIIPEAMIGGLSVSGWAGPGSPWFLRSSGDLKVEAGRTTRVEVRPVKGIRLKGVVRERLTGRPIPWVELSPLGPHRDDDAIAVTDAEGRFALFAPGGANLFVASAPEAYAHPYFVLEAPDVPKGADEVELPPIELSRAGTVRGVVVDDRGEPVPGATVTASWMVDEGAGKITGRQTRALTGRRGEFLVDRVAIATRANLSATAPDGRRTARVVVTKVGDEPARLVLDLIETASLAGRVVDASGRRVVDARVHLRLAERHPGGQIMGSDLVEIGGAHVIRTAGSGWFRTPPILDPNREYAAVVEADGYAPAWTGWIPGKARTFPELVLRPASESRLTTVDGTVADRSGRPVAGAAAWITNGQDRPIRGTTDARGRFRLEGVLGRRSFLFVEAAGFRFSGRVIDPGAGSVSVALTRPDERPTATMTTLPPVLPRDQERALARQAIVPYAERVLQDRDRATLLRVLEVLPLSDPARVLEAIPALAALPNGSFKDDWSRDYYLRRPCVPALWEEDRPEALAVVEAMETAEWRSRIHLDLCDAMPADDREARLEQVDEAMVQARAIPKADTRIQALGQVAEHYLDLGAVDNGTKLLRETLPAARELPKVGWAGYARGSFAEELSHVDPDAALALIDGLGEKPSPDRHRINLARELAARDPARAEGLLSNLRDPDILARTLPGLCYAIARKDPDRARRLADRDVGTGIQARQVPFVRPYSLGMIALAIADSDKTRAARVLDEAFAALIPMAAEGRRGLGDLHDAARVGAAMVPVAERIDPALVPKFFWRAASLGAPRTPATGGEPMPDAVLALLLARYDRDAAMVLLAPLLDRKPIPKDMGLSPLVRALAAVDPGRAVVLVESLPEDRGFRLSHFDNFKNEARLDLSEFLGHPPAQRWDRIIGRLLYLWVVGDEDSI